MFFIYCKYLTKIYVYKEKQMFDSQSNFLQKKITEPFCQIEIKVDDLIENVLH